VKTDGSRQDGDSERLALSRANADRAHMKKLHGAPSKSSSDVRGKSYRNMNSAQETHELFSTPEPTEYYTDSHQANGFYGISGVQKLILLDGRRAQASAHTRACIHAQKKQSTVPNTYNHNLTSSHMTLANGGRPSWCSRRSSTSSSPRPPSPRP